LPPKILSSLIPNSLNTIIGYFKSKVKQKMIRFYFFLFLYGRFVPKIKQRKENKVYRYLKMSDKLLAMILNYRISNELKDNDFILAKKTNEKAIARKTLEYILKYNVSQVLGKEYLDRAHPHALRHTRAIHLLDSGMNIMLLKNFLGHKNITNTLIYLKYSNSDMTAALDKANNFVY